MLTHMSILFLVAFCFAACGTTRLAETKPEETKPEEIKPEEIKPEEIKPKEITPLDIYKLIRIDTSPFDADKERWVILDQKLIKEVLVQLISNVSNAVASDSIEKILGNTQRLVQYAQEGEVRIVCRKRYYDDEIEHIGFQRLRSSEVEYLGGIEDFVLIKNALGEEMYNKLKGERYKERYSSVQGRRYDLYFHALDPEIMLWSTLPTHEWWRVSAVGKLGNDNLDLPFWFKGSIVAALKVSYIDDWTIRNKNYSAFSITAGIEEPINFSVPGDPKERSSNSLFKERKLHGSGSSVYLRATYTPYKKRSDQDIAQYIECNLEISLAVQEKEQYPIGIPPIFYSIRNYITGSAHFHHLGIFELGAGLTWHDLHHISRVPPPPKLIERVEPTKGNIVPFLEVGVAEEGNILHYAVSTQVNYNVSEGFGFFVVKSLFILRNTFGVDLRYFKSIRTGHLPPWHYDSYIAFSPVVRINF
jgi:hypothetical protein